MVPVGQWSGEHADPELEWETLTDRERQILNGIVAGRSNPEMAAELFVSVNTIRFHVTNVLRKLNVRSRVDAAVMAARHV
ncbi:response regulator transcription factor [Rhodococcus koreensis]